MRMEAEPGRETRSRETAGRVVNALWEGVNDELRTSPTPPQEMLFWGREYMQCRARVQGGRRLPHRSARPPSAPLSQPPSVVLEPSSTSLPVKKVLFP